MGKKKIILYIIITILIIIIGIYIYSIFYLFDNDDLRQIQQININMDKRIEIIHVPSNVSSPDYIQIRGIDRKKNKVYILENYASFNYLEYAFIRDSMLILVIKDTISRYPLYEGADTFRLNLNNFLREEVNTDSLKYVLH